MSTIPAAPISAPAVAPAPVSAPAAPPPVSTPVVPAAPPAPVAPSAPAPPDPKNYPGDKFAEFRADKAKYAAEHPEGEPDAAAAPVEVPPVAPPETVKPEDPVPVEIKPEDAAPAEPATLDEEPSYTPQAITELANRKPALKALLDADPEIKGMMYSQARQIAALKPLGDLFTDVPAAQFAAQTSAEYVGLRTKFQTAESPEDRKGAMSAFVDQFKIVDDKGNPVLENGKPKLAADYYTFTQTFLDTHIDGAMAEIDERLTANNYHSAEAREKDENRKLAYEFIRDDKEDGDSGPDLSALPAEVREQLDRERKELKDKNDELSGKQKAQSEEEHAAQKTAYYQAYTKEIGGRIKAVFDSTIKPLREAGVHIPSYLLESPDGKTVPQFVARVIGQFKDITGKTAKVLQDRVALEMLPMTPENRQRRVEYEDKLYQNLIPKLIKTELRSISAKMKSDLEQANKKPDSANVSAEPAGGGAPPAGTSWTLETSMAEARKLVDAEATAKGEYLDTADRNLRITTKARQLRGQR